MKSWRGQARDEVVKVIWQSAGKTNNYDRPRPWNELLFSSPKCKTTVKSRQISWNRFLHLIELKSELKLKSAGIFRPEDCGWLVCFGYANERVRAGPHKSPPARVINVNDLIKEGSWLDESIKDGACRDWLRKSPWQRPIQQKFVQ